MKRTLSGTEAKKRIDSFFQKEFFTPEEVGKIKRLAMKHKIKLKNYRKLFCKKCFSQLKGRIRISKTHKTIICDNCGYKNRFRPF